MRIHIDTNTFPASPALYADAGKTKPLPRVLPAVELQKGGFAVAFIGDNGPKAGETLYLAASLAETGVQVLAEWSEDYANGAWGFDFALTSEALAEEVKKRGSARLLVGIISDDDVERREWQFNTVVYPTASSGEIDVETVESAKNFAELAEQAAKRAQEAQADVAGNAQLAENAKQTATQAANAAIGAADNAEVSERNAAESKDAAEQAKTDAEAAKAEAKKAASDAQTTLSNVYTKAEIDGVSTGAEVVLKMNEIIAMLKDYEEVTGEKLPLEFWEAVMAEFQRWQKNPNKTENWETNNPYTEVVPVKPIVDFSVTKAKNFNRSIDCILFLPALTTAFLMLSDRSKYNSLVIAPNATSIQGIFQYSSSFNRPMYFPAATICSYMFTSGSKFSSFAILPRCSSASGGFRYTAMSAENISKTLDSLPTWTDGASHVITFTGSLGCAELTQDSPSVAAAIVKGWTVEL